MYFLQKSCQVLSIFFICFVSVLSTSSFRIENCTTVLGNNLPDTIYNVKMNAEIVLKTNNVGLVKNMKFFVFQYKYNGVSNFTIHINSMKTFHAQRLIEYKSQEYQDIVKSYCSLTFIYDYDTSLNVPYGLEYDVILHAENCIERVLCNFYEKDHKIGDDIHVISKTRHEEPQTTTQATVNSLVDLIVGTTQNSLIKGNKSIIQIPKFEASSYKIKFSTSGGALDILKYIKRDGDLTFGYEGHRYVINTILRLIGGYVQLNDVSISSVVGEVIKGKLPINTTDTSLRMKIVVDFNQKPCKISATDIVLNQPSEQVDFSGLKVKIMGYEVTSVEKILKALFLKYSIVSLINNEIVSQFKLNLEKLKCEDYRGILLNNTKKNI